MKTTELNKGKEYYYTAGAEWVKVRYLYETINGWMFFADGVRNELTQQSVQQYIEEI